MPKIAEDLIINEKTYTRCVTAFSLVENHLGLKIKYERDPELIAEGQILLFNHFARFETVIPQYIVHQATGEFCRCVADKALFHGNEKVAAFLKSVGAVPNDLPGLLPFLAAEILRGHKVIVFPEGGMIKDKRVVDDDGSFSIFSPSAKRRRKHHTGASSIAITLAVFKQRILNVNRAGQMDRLDRWVKAVGLESREALLKAAQKPTVVIPSNITFYPLRVSDNVLTKALNFLGSSLRGQAAEEILIEGNLIFKATDMNIRLGDPVSPHIEWKWYERIALNRLFARISSLEELFTLRDDGDSLFVKIASTILYRETKRIRDQTMNEMYENVTLHLGHLISRLILSFTDQGHWEVSKSQFHRALYHAIKIVQRIPDLHLHEDLRDPEAYRGLLTGDLTCLEDFYDMATATELMEIGEKEYRFLPKVQEMPSFHLVRIENPVLVYANEMAPLAKVIDGVTEAMDIAARGQPMLLADLRFDDELRVQAWNKQKFSGEDYLAINSEETATQSGAPFLLRPPLEKRKDLGVLLVHGYLASPAEVRPFGEKLEASGYPVLGIRLAGHGTSPWDLNGRKWQDWLESVERGYEILAAEVERVVVVGFSTGASLALLHAAAAPAKLAGVVSISAPLYFANADLVIAPVIRGVNRLTGWVTGSAGVLPFWPNESEHPDINYHNIPINTSAELNTVVDELKRKMKHVKAPAFILQGDSDPVVLARSGPAIFDNLGSEEKAFRMIHSDRHGILYENIDGTQKLVARFIDDLAAGDFDMASYHVATKSPPQEEIDLEPVVTLSET